MIRTDIYEAIHERIVAAFPKPSIVLFATDADLKVPPGTTVVGIFPGEDDYWSEGSQDSGRSWEMSIVVQVARARGAQENELQSWSGLEDSRQRVVVVVVVVVVMKDLRLGGAVSSLDLGSIEPSEKPVGGVGYGLDVEFVCRYERN